MAEKKKNNFRLKLTPAKKAAVKKRLLEARASLTIAYQLGYYVGEDIVNRRLPTLSVDSLKTRNVIKATPEEEVECKRLNDVWFSKRMAFRGDEKEATKATKKEWDEMRAYHEMLEEKYLSKTLECHFSCLNISEKDMAEFKKGIGVSLWNCDCSHYSCNAEDIQVTPDEDGWFTVITLKKA